MIRIVATAEQIRQLNAADGLIEIVDENGKRIGVVAREIDLEDIRTARARLESNQPRLSYAAVLEYLHGLETS
jgi:hypothetical protein